MGIPHSHRTGAVAAGSSSRRFSPLTRARVSAAASQVLSTRAILEFGLFAAILIAVAAFGGTQPVAWGISESLIFLLGILLVARPLALPS